MHTDRRERIIVLLPLSFSEYGFKGTTMDSIAKIAKVGKGTVYTHFDHKEQLFDEIIDRTLIHMMTAADDA